MRYFLWLFTLATTGLLADPQGSVTEEIPVLQAPSYESAFMKMIFALLGLILLFVISIWMLKKISKFRLGKGRSQAIQIVERCSLSPKTVLYLVEVDNKRVLLAESQLEVRRLESVDLVQEELS